MSDPTAVGLRDALTRGSSWRIVATAVDPVSGPAVPDPWDGVGDDWAFDWYDRLRRIGGAEMTFYRVVTVRCARYGNLLVEMIATDRRRGDDGVQRYVVFSRDRGGDGDKARLVTLTSTVTVRAGCAHVPGHHMAITVADLDRWAYETRWVLIEPDGRPHFTSPI